MIGSATFILSMCLPSLSYQRRTSDVHFQIRVMSNTHQIFNW